VVAGIGGAAVVAGLVWIWRAPKPTSKPTPAVAVTPDSVHASWSITF
jgi:hypothetical protein